MKVERWRYSKENFLAEPKVERAYLNGRVMYGRNPMEESTCEGQ